MTRPKKKATKPPRRPNIRWDTHKRQVLCCLYRFFCRDPKVWEEVFSHIFMSHLIERGIAGFVPFQTLNIQWTHMRDHGDTDWHHVHIATEFNKDGEWKDIIARIKSAARSLRLQIREKDEDSVDTSRWKPPGLLALRTEQAPPLAAPMSVSWLFKACEEPRKLLTYPLAMEVTRYHRPISVHQPGQGVYIS